MTSAQKNPTPFGVGLKILYLIYDSYFAYVVAA